MATSLITLGPTAFWFGFSSDATHTTGDGGPMARLPGESMQFPLKHPAAVEALTAADRWEDSHIFESRVSLAQRVRNRLASFVQIAAAVGATFRGKSDQR